MEMVETKTDLAEEILNHHLTAFMNNDVQEIMKDYDDNSEIWTAEGAICGLDAIETFFNYAFSLFPKQSTKFELKQQITKQNKAYIVWTAETEQLSIPLGSDTFLIKDGKINLQTTAVHFIQK